MMRRTRRSRAAGRALLVAVPLAVASAAGPAAAQDRVAIEQIQAAAQRAAGAPGRGIQESDYILGNQSGILLLNPSGPPQSAQANQARALQIGSGNTGTIDMSGYANVAIQNVIGSRNTVTQQQAGSYNQSTVSVFGQSNTIGTQQDGSGAGGDHHGPRRQQRHLGAAAGHKPDADQHHAGRQRPQRLGHPEVVPCAQSCLLGPLVCGCALLAVADAQAGSLVYQPVNPVLRRKSAERLLAAGPGRRPERRAAVGPARPAAVLGQPERRQHQDSGPDLRPAIADADLQLAGQPDHPGALRRERPAERQLQLRRIAGDLPALGRQHPTPDLRRPVDHHHRRPGDGSGRRRLDHHDAGSRARPERGG